MALTGRFDFRKTLMSKIVLQVEEQVPAFWFRGSSRPMKRRWRNANLMDLTATELRGLMDMGSRPQFMGHHVEVDRATPTPRANIAPMPSRDAQTTSVSRGWQEP